MKILRKITGITWSHNHDGAAYYKDDRGLDWYTQRNKLPEGKTIIVVDSETKKIMTFWKGDPTKVGLHVPKICKMVDVYQIETDMEENYFFGRYWKFIDNEFVEYFIDTPETNGYKKLDLLTKSTSEIGVLTDKIEFNIATESEIKYLKELRLYRIAVYDVDIEKAVWPEPPVK